MIKKIQLSGKNTSGNDLYIAGIISTEPDYKLCWAINQCIQLELVRTDDLKLNSTIESPDIYNVYRYFDEDYNYSVYLLNNKGSTSYFQEKLKKVDYFLLIKGDEAEKHAATIISKLKNNSFTIIPIDMAVLKKGIERFSLLE